MSSILRTQQAIERNQRRWARKLQIYEMAKANPDMSYARIGEKFGIRRSRVGYILEEVERGFSQTNQENKNQETPAQG